MHKNFGVELIDYNRGSGVLISSGCGLGLAIMDNSNFRYFVDIDRYRYDSIDWECVGILLSRAKLIAMVGWFTIDTPVAFTKIERGLLVKPHKYIGGGETSLATFMENLTHAEIDFDH